MFGCVAKFMELRQGSYCNRGMRSLSLGAGSVVAQTEMATVMDFARPGSHLLRHECLSSSHATSCSSCVFHRLSCTAGCLPNSVTVAGPSSSWTSLATQLVVVPIGPALKSKMSQAGRARAASGSVQQEEIASVGTMTVGQCAVQGLREEMEDEIAVVVDGPNGFSYAAIFDGHAGVFSAKFLRDELYKECLKALKGGGLLKSDDLHEAEEAISRAFLQTDKRLISRLEKSKKIEEAESGSTATVLFVRSNRFVVAHVGDSRAVLSRNGIAQNLTSDHRPFGRDKKSFLEIKRIQEAGGWVSHGRVCGTLSVSRAFGDIPFKTQKQKYVNLKQQPCPCVLREGSLPDGHFHVQEILIRMLDSGVAEKRWTQSFANGRTKNISGEWLIAKPDTSSMLVQEEVDFIILGSDGLWDSLNSAEAVNFVRKGLREHGDVQRASEEIAQEALNRGGQDNVSVIIVDLGRSKVDPVSVEAPSWKFW
ncbi:protein phosphatase 2C 57 isoform X2 [Physcomitrium patens]|uniref:protein-serine/threonine phosphatase n=1 Tax=Physcomitrium patens TaxID=3218 RepID=A0A7I4AN82_PHYPA|nr:protein phosphatase 2C 57-like isoform X2 [Physcomitrium patens]|eukprot:XP_024394745.1 protein phosphatase 2C 57-like isoform X2 [Physcomitrella patens]